MCYIYHGKSQHDVDAVLSDRPPVVLLSIRKHARSTKHLDNRDQDEDHKDNPHNPVATKKTIQEIHIANIYIPQIARRQAAHPLTLREDTKNMNNANKEQTIYGIIYLHPSHNQKNSLPLRFISRKPSKENKQHEYRHHKVRLFRWSWRHRHERLGALLPFVGQRGGRV
jgi:hypothetical protein